MRTGRILAALTICAAAWPAGCGARPAAAPSGLPAAPATTSTSAVVPVTEPVARTQPWFDLQVGDCVDQVPAVDEGVVDVTLVDCSAVHRAEVYQRVPIPVDAAVTDVANQRCTEALTAYTHRAADFTISYLIDSNQDRTAANPLPSTVICLLQAAGGAPLSTSARSG